MMRSLKLSLCLLAAASLFIASVGQATPLNLVLQTPDIGSEFIDITYDAGTDAFAADGFAMQLDGVDLDVFGFYSISATIDGSGVLSGGTISVTGEIGGFTSGTLLTGTLTDFGFVGDAAGMIFEFTFDITGGDLLPSYGGQPGGVIMSSALSGFSGFGSNFDNIGTAGIADTAPVPEPGTALLLMGGLALLSGSRRR